MPSTFNQPEVNLREVANDVCGLTDKVAQNAQALLPLVAYSGKNLLINGDMSVPQRGASGTFIPTDSYSVDRLVGAADNVTTWTHFSGGLSNDSRIEIAHTSNDNYSWVSQRVESLIAQKLVGKTVTIAWDVMSNEDHEITSHLGVPDGFDDWSVETLLVSKTFQLKANTRTTITMTVDLTSLPNIADGVGAFLDSIWDFGDILSIYNMQMELGSEFTGFEIVPPAIQLVNCLRYFRVSESTGQAAEFAHSMRALPTETGVGPYHYDAEL